jgi:glycine cleavage system regulatory protein
MCRANRGATAIFQARATIHVPAASSLAALRHGIERVAAELPLEVRFLAPD